MRRAICVVGLLFVSLWHGPTSAQQTGPVVVELYTSQGCSSCPPADKLLGELVGRDDVIPLSLHVDYWDYLGWRDEFGSSAYSKRQRAYARAAGKRTVYTPQMIIHGQDFIVGSRPRQVKASLSKSGSRKSSVALSVEQGGGRMKISISPTASDVGKSVIHVIGYTKKSTVNIKRGENAGRSITYHNTVRSWNTIGKWNGRKAHSLTAKMPKADGVVVIVQSEGYGPVLAATRVK
jgi:hypothetical protein